ncbi:MAG: dethiobiotin synthase [Prevotellaceae bacterium]|jgi:dethiobiotin synthetase|nr:dethiobiotin synthase [Prevotellaceae bacterium]
MSKTIFITGIDTNTGKSYATGYIAKQFMEQGKKVITQKFIQTGNYGISEDIEIHRKVMGIDLLQDDIDGVTCPVILSYPASPHLAAKIDKVDIDIKKITAATIMLKKRYDIILIEGAGGIMTPVNDSITTLDYIAARRYPVIIVTSPKLGSINHTLLTLEICSYYNIKVTAVAYSKFGVYDRIICDDTEQYLKKYIRNFKHCAWIEIPDIV